MSRKFDFMSTWPDSLANVMAHAVPQYLIFPFPSLATPPSGEFFPLARTIEQAAELWWRAKQLSLDFDFSYDGAGVTANFLLNRQYLGADITDELDLARPEVLAAVTDPINPISNLWTGSVSLPDWNGLGGLLELQCTAYFFFTGTPDDHIAPVNGPDTFLHWPSDAAIYPAISIFIRGNVSTPGLESPVIFRTHPAPVAPATAFRKATTAELFGESIAATFDDDLDADAQINALEIESWYPWDGTWNPATGARLA